MELLNSYLKAVRIYLPKTQREDIIKELSENLLSQMEEKEAALGRPLTEDEEESILLKHGDPWSVARRYGGASRGVSFGVQIIGPEIFPLYRGILLFDWILTSVIFILQAIGGLRFTVSMFLTPIFIQFVLLTLIFSIIERLQRNSRQHWNFPPAYLQPVPRWQSISGIVIWSIAGACWLGVPVFRLLLFGATGGNVKLTPVWEIFYVPILLLWLAGLAQRCINLIRPQWNWLLPVTRLAVNGVGTLLQYLIWKDLPAVVATDGAASSAHYKAMAAGLNGLVQWGLLSWLWIWLSLNALWYVWLCAQHLRHWVRQRRQVAASA